LFREESDLIGRYAREVRYSAGLRDKYKRAADYPWLPVAPDPPYPE
jgi:hypothetical protein